MMLKVKVVGVPLVELEVEQFSLPITAYTSAQTQETSSDEKTT